MSVSITSPQSKLIEVPQFPEIIWVCSTTGQKYYEIQYKFKDHDSWSTCGKIESDDDRCSMQLIYDIAGVDFYEIYYRVIIYYDGDNEIGPVSGKDISATYSVMFRHGIAGTLNVYDGSGILKYSFYDQVNQPIGVDKDKVEVLNISIDEEKTAKIPLVEKNSAIGTNFIINIDEKTGFVQRSVAKDSPSFAPNYISTETNIYQIAYYYTPVYQYNYQDVYRYEADYSYQPVYDSYANYSYRSYVSGYTAQKESEETPKGYTYYNKQMDYYSSYNNYAYSQYAYYTNYNEQTYGYYPYNEIKDKYVEQGYYSYKSYMTTGYINDPTSYFYITVNNPFYAYREYALYNDSSGVNEHTYLDQNVPLHVEYMSPAGETYADRIETLKEYVNMQKNGTRVETDGTMARYLIGSVYNTYNHYVPVYNTGSSYVPRGYYTEGYGYAQRVESFYYVDSYYLTYYYNTLYGYKPDYSSQAAQGTEYYPVAIPTGYYSFIDASYYYNYYTYIYYQYYKAYATGEATGFLYYYRYYKDKFYTTYTYTYYEVTSDIGYKKKSENVAQYGGPGYDYKYGGATKYTGKSPYYYRYAYQGNGIWTGYGWSYGANYAYEKGYYYYYGYNKYYTKYSYYYVTGYYKRYYYNTYTYYYNDELSATYIKTNYYWAGPESVYKSSYQYTHYAYGAFYDRKEPYGIYNQWYPFTYYSWYSYYIYQYQSRTYNYTRYYITGYSSYVSGYETKYKDTIAVYKPGQRIVNYKYYYNFYTDTSYINQYTYLEKEYYSTYNYISYYQYYQIRNDMHYVVPYNYYESYYYYRQYIDQVPTYNPVEVHVDYYWYQPWYVTQNYYYNKAMLAYTGIYVCGYEVLGQQSQSYNQIAYNYLQVDKLYHAYYVKDGYYYSPTGYTYMYYIPSSEPKYGYNNYISGQTYNRHYYYIKDVYFNYQTYTTYYYKYIANYDYIAYNNGTYTNYVDYYYNYISGYYSEFEYSYKYDYVARYYISGYGYSYYS